MDSRGPSLSLRLSELILGISFPANAPVDNEVGTCQGLGSNMLDAGYIGQNGNTNSQAQQLSSQLRSQQQGADTVAALPVTFMTPRLELNPSNLAQKLLCPELQRTFYPLVRLSLFNSR